MLMLHLIIQLWSIRDLHGSNILIDGYMNTLWHCHFDISYSFVDLCGVVTTPNADAPAYTLPLVDNSDIDFPCLIIWTIVHQVLYLLLTTQLNAYPLLIRTSSAEAPGTDHLIAGSSSLLSNTVINVILLHNFGLAVTVTIILLGEQVPPPIWTHLGFAPLLL